MKDLFKMGLVFLAGAVVGSVITKKYVESKITVYEEETIDEIIMEDETYATTKPEETERPIITSTDSIEYNRLLDELRYKKQQENIIDAENEVEECDPTKPYYISEEEFEERDDFESDEYTYYADGYLTDSYGMPVDDGEMVRLLGVDFSKYFDKYDNDQIWIRNITLQMDFSIIRDLDRFEDVAPPRIKRMVGL